MRFSLMIAGCAALCLTAFVPRAEAQTTDQVTLLTLSEVLTLSQSDPQAALARIEQILPLVPADALRIRYDLFVLRADLLAQQGRLTEAAQLTAELAQFAEANRFVLSEDPALLWDQAARLFEDAGHLSTARLALDERLRVLREGGLSEAQLAPVYARIDALTDKIGDRILVEPMEEAIVEPAPSEDGVITGTRNLGEEGDFREVDVYYATDRARSGLDDPNQFYGYGRGDLEMGIARVTIPASHRSSAIERPSIWKLQFRENPAKHVVLQSVTPVESDAFFGSMRSHLNEANANSAFVFIHGYNVSFDQAARRAAQLAYDTAFPGIPVLYSWPSRGTTAGYVADTAVVRLSGRRLSRFLDELVDKSGATTIHIVAHSMGNRALTDALELLALRRGLGEGDAPIFDQVLFAAPDVDAELFAEMMPTIRPVAKRLTLYASEQDWALFSSRHLHGDAPRAGQGGADMIARPEFDSVDMSELGEDMLAHSYFAGDRSALADMVALFWRNAAPELRCGLQAKTLNGSEVPIWQYLKDVCANSDLVSVFAQLQNAQAQDFAAAEKIVAEAVGDAEKIKEIMPVVAKLFGD